MFCYLCFCPKRRDHPPVANHRIPLPLSCPSHQRPPSSPTRAFSYRTPFHPNTQPQQSPRDYSPVLLIHNHHHWASPSNTPIASCGYTAGCTAAQYSSYKTIHAMNGICALYRNAASICSAAFPSTAVNKKKPTRCAHCLHSGPASIATPPVARSYGHRNTSCLHHTARYPLPCPPPTKISRKCIVLFTSVIVSG